MRFFILHRRDDLYSILMFAAIALAIILAVAGPASAANTTFYTSPNGDVTLPISPPNKATGAAGAIDNMNIGASSPSAIRGSSLASDTGTKTATATAGAATLNKTAGVVTSEALTTIAGATYTLTLANTTVAAGDQVFASVALGTATTGTPAVATVTASANQVVIVVQNIAASAVFNGSIKVSYLVMKN